MPSLCESARGSIPGASTPDWAEKLGSRDQRPPNRPPKTLGPDRLIAEYSHEFRDPGLYSEDDAAISAKVRTWALEHGDDPDLRIALCGYSGEHEMPGWTEYAWKGARGYASEDNNNRERERIWFSPHCLQFEEQRSLFSNLATADQMAATLEAS